MEGTKLNRSPDMIRAKSFTQHRDSGPNMSPRYQTATPSLLKRWRKVTMRKRPPAKGDSRETGTPLDDLICLDGYHETSGEHEPKVIVSKFVLKASLLELLKSNGSSVDVLGDIESVENITAENAVCVLRGWSPLEKNVGFLAAALFNRSDIIEAFVLSNVDMAYAEPKLGFNALQIGAFAGASEIVAFLVDHGMSVNVVVPGNYTALHCAALGNCPEAARLLLAAGAAVNTITLGGETVLHAAVRARSGACVRIFVEHGADANAVDGCGITALHIAADLGDVDCVRALVDSGRCDVEQHTRTDQNTALHLACQGGSMEVVSLLLDRGALPNAKNVHLKTPLHFSAKVCMECTEVLLRRGADPNASDVECRTPLHAAVSKSEVRFGPEITTLLLNWNARVNAKDKYGYTPLHIAALNELTECVESLLLHNADVSARTRGGTSALGLVARKTPTALSFVRQQLDSCITCNDPSVSYREVRLQFNFRYLLHSEEQGEIAFLQTFVDEGQRELLEHPLCEAFLCLKWQKIGKYYTTRLTFCFLHVFLLSAYILTAISYQCYHTVQPRIMINENTLCESKYGKFLTENPFIVETLYYLLLSTTILEIIRKLFGINGYKSIREYLSLANLVEWFVVMAVFATSFFLTGSTHVWQNQIGAFATLLGWANLMVKIGNLPQFGSYVAMYTRVQKQFAKLLAAYVCLLIGFTVCFCTMFVDAPNFANPFIGFIKILVMMVGEFDFGDLLKEITEKEERLPTLLPLFVFVLFVFFVTIILINLMIGIAVHDIQGLQKTAGLSKLVGLTNLISHIETALFASRVPACLSKLLNSSAKIGRTVVYVKPLNPQEKILPRELMRSALEVARQARCKRADDKRTDRLTHRRRLGSQSANQDIVDLIVCLSNEVKELKRLVLK